MIFNDPDLQVGDHYRALGESEWHTVTQSDVDETRAALRAAEEAAAYTPPNPYAELATLRAATEATASPFEQKYRAARRAEFAATRVALDAEEPLVPVGDEGTDIPPAPRSYDPAIAALRASEAKPAPAMTFEEKYKAQRLAEFQDEYKRAKERR